MATKIFDVNGHTLVLDQELLGLPTDFPVDRFRHSKEPNEGPRILQFQESNCRHSELLGFWRWSGPERFLTSSAGSSPPNTYTSCQRVVPRILPTLHWVDQTHPTWDERRPKTHALRFAVDFDEVIHQGRTRFTVPTEILDPPFPGAFAWIQDLVEGGVTFIVHTCRLTHWSPSNPYLFHEMGEDVEAALKAWFLFHGMPAVILDQIHFWRYVGKPSADVYIDDKAFCFHGRFPTALAVRGAMSRASEDRFKVLEMRRIMAEGVKAE